MADLGGLSAAARWRRRHPERLRASRAATLAALQRERRTGGRRRGGTLAALGRERRV